MNTKLTDQQSATLTAITHTDQWQQLETTELLDLIELHIEYLRDTMSGPALASRVFVLRNIARKLTPSDPALVLRDRARNIIDSQPVRTLDAELDTRHWQCPKCSNRVTTHLRGTLAWCNRHAGGLTPMKADQ